MTVRSELLFLRRVTLGLFNKEGVSFFFGTRPHSKGTLVEILIVNGISTTHGNSLRLNLSYFLGDESVSVRLQKNGDFVGAVEVSKIEAPKAIKALITRAEKDKGTFSRFNSDVDYYGIITKLSKQAFESNERFELNGWKTCINIDKYLGTPRDQLLNVHHVNGGVGSANNTRGINEITTSIEFARHPITGVPYLGVFRSIAPNPKFGEGVYDRVTIDMFTYAVVEQYQNAWNRTSK